MLDDVGSQRQVDRGSTFKYERTRPPELTTKTQQQQGGQAVVDAVLQGTHSFLYTETEMDIVVRSVLVFFVVGFWGGGGLPSNWISGCSVYR